MNFPFDPKGYTAGQGWRPLKIADPLQQGWDVYELQSRLASLGSSISVDGFFGPQTKNYVVTFQKVSGLVADGIAGVKTQVETGLRVAAMSDLPQRIHGQMEKESSLLCGIYTAPYANRSIDRGAVQENSQFYTNNDAAFDVRQSIPVLVRSIEDQHAKYIGWGVEDKRAWDAAQGHWNNQVNADAYAKGKMVPASFLQYIAAVTAYA
jgi:peptidoglycan hydrolase-like protein with peptidoglycan-binding domain